MRNPPRAAKPQGNEAKPRVRCYSFPDGTSYYRDDSGAIYRMDVREASYVRTWLDLSFERVPFIGY